MMKDEGKHGEHVLQSQIAADDQGARMYRISSNGRPLFFL